MLDPERIRADQKVTDLPGYDYITRRELEFGLPVLLIGTEEPSGKISGSISKGTLLYSGAASLK